jgi:hypothetical protein
LRLEDHCLKEQDAEQDAEPDADTDLYQNVTDPERWLKGKKKRHKD